MSFLHPSFLDRQIFSYSALPPIGTIYFQKKSYFLFSEKILFLNIGSLIVKMSSTEKELNQIQKKRGIKNSKVKLILFFGEIENLFRRRIFSRMFGPSHNQTLVSTFNSDSKYQRI